MKLINLISYTFLTVVSVTNALTTTKTVPNFNITTTLISCPKTYTDLKCKPYQITGRDTYTSRYPGTKIVSCTGYRTYCTNIKASCTSLKNKTLNIKCKKGQSASTQILRSSESGELCTWTSTTCTSTTTTTTTTTTTKKKTPIIYPSPSACPETKAIPVTCKSSEVKTSIVITSVNAAKSVCTRVSHYCKDPNGGETTINCPVASKQIPKCSQGSTTSTTTIHSTYNGVPCTYEPKVCVEDTITTPPIIKTTTTINPTVNPSPKACPEVKTLPVICKTGEIKTSRMITSTISSKGVCTKLSHYCTKTNYTVPSANCPFTTKYIASCRPGSTISIATFHYTHSGTPCVYYPRTCVESTAKTTSPIIATTTPITPINSSKCIPVTLTITEKNIETITEKVTVTMTITGDSSNQPITDDQHCGSKFAQCGGKGFKGATCCKSGLSCHQISEYYHQCY